MALGNICRRRKNNAFVASTGIEPVSEAPETSILSVELRSHLCSCDHKISETVGEDNTRH
jgi:hypothetical protein